MQRSCSWLPLLALCASASAAWADRVEGSTRGEPLTVSAPRVTATLVDGTARFRVRYDVINPTRHADSALVQLETPPGARVVSVQHRFGDRWIAGRLLDADVAQERFSAYRDAPFVASRSVLLLSDDDGGGGELSLSSVPARGRIAVEYELVAPACYAAGRWYATYPRLEPEAIVTAAGARVEARAVAERGLGGSLAEACSGFEGVDGGDEVRVLSWPGVATSLRGRVTTVPLGGAGFLQVLDVAVGATLAEAPTRPAVVFVLDASRSLGDDGVAEQLQVLRGYLVHARDARVEVVVVRRHATRLFGALLPARAALARLATLERTALAVANGSNLDAGLTLAASILAAASGPRRLVAFTDDELRPGLTDAGLAASLAGLPPDAVAHVVFPDAGPSGVTRDFDSHLNAPIAPWGGVVASVSAGGDAAPLLELVRPIRLERIARGGDVIVEELGEGHGARFIDLTPDAQPISAWLWGRRWSPTRADRPADWRRAARLGLDVAESAGDDAARVVSALAMAATRRTSFLGERPGWTPSGLEDPSGTSATCGCDAPGTIGHGGGTGMGILPGRAVLPPPPPELPAILRARVEACAATVAAEPWQVALAVAITGVEVVDVHATATGVADAGARARLESCALEAAWDLDLDASYRRYTRTYAVTFAR